jgi:hypothetical protein
MSFVSTGYVNSLEYSVVNAQYTNNFYINKLKLIG